MSEKKDETLSRLEEEGEVAADYLEELLDIADLDGDIEIDVENGRASVEIVADDATGLENLVGEDGEVLDALQELTRLAVQTEMGERSRLMLDIAGFRADRRVQLRELTQEAINRLNATGEPQKLEPMNPFERKVCHDVVAEAGLHSESEGADPHRYVVISDPRDDESDDVDDDADFEDSDSDDESVNEVRALEELQEGDFVASASDVAEATSELAERDDE